MSTPRVALIGAAGHGAWHLRYLEPLHRVGRLRLVAVCDVRPVTASPDAPLPDDVDIYTDHRELLAEVRPDAVIVCTPPHTHLAIATDALRAGCDVLLEKPPTPTLAEQEQLAAVVAETGGLVQVGFQALGSAALAELLHLVRSGRLGQVTGISAACARMRPDAYYARSRWAGKREVDGRPSADGALANVFAHAVMNCFALVAAAGGDPTPERIEVERYRCRDIEVEDTATLRIVPRSGPPVLIAVTLCAPETLQSDIVVHTSTGRVVLDYNDDRLQLPDAPAEEVPDRVNLLVNLLDHRADPSMPLLAPLERTEPFTRWLDAMREAPLPVAIAEKYTVVHGEGDDRWIEIPGIVEAVDAAAERLATFSELGLPWAEPPVAVSTVCNKPANRED